MFRDATHPTYAVVGDLGPGEAVGNHKDIVAVEVPVDDSMSVEEHQSQCYVVKKVHLLVEGERLEESIQVGREVVLTELHDEDG